MAVGGEVSFLLVQAELASLHQSHGRKSLPWLWLRYASRLNSSVRPRMKLLAVLVLLLQASASYSQPAEHCPVRSEEHTSELQSLMRISYAVFCLKKKNNKSNTTQE